MKRRGNFDKISGSKIQKTVEEEVVEPIPTAEQGVVLEVLSTSDTQGGVLPLVPPTSDTQDVVSEEEEEQELNLKDLNYPSLNMPFKVSGKASEVGLKMYEDGGRKLVVNREATGTYMDGETFETEEVSYEEYTIPKQVLADMAQWATKRHTDTYYYGIRVADSALVFLAVETLLLGIREDLRDLIARIRSARDENQGLESVVAAGDTERGQLDRIKSLVEGIRKTSVLDPIDVSTQGDDTYTIVNGNHRVIASMFMSLARIPARVMQQ